MSALSQRVKERRKELDLTQAELAERTDVGQTVIARLESGATPSPRNWRQIADALEIPHDDFRALMIEAGREAGKTTRIPRALQPVIAETIRQITQPVQPPPVPNARYGGTARAYGLRDVPVYGRASTGEDGAFEFNGEVLGWELRPPQLEGVRDAYCIFISGTSMYPRYRDGETCWINPNKPARKGDDVCVQIEASDESGVPLGYVKELVGFKGNKLVLWQHNPPKELEFDRDKVRSIHLVEMAGRR